MSKQFIVRLKAGNRILANSQIITLRGLGTGPILADDFSDASLSGTIITTGGRAVVDKIVTIPQWDLLVTATTINGGSSIALTWRTVKPINGPLSYFATNVNTNTKYSGPALFTAGGINNFNAFGTTGSLSIPTKPIGTDEQLQITLWQGDIGTGTFYARSPTITINKISLFVNGAATVREGQQIVVTVTGAPGERVSFSGETSGIITLDAFGKFSTNLSAGVVLSLGTYSWIFDGDVTTNTPSYITTVVPNYNLTVVGPSISTKSSPLKVSVSGAPNEILTITASGLLAKTFNLSNTGLSSIDLNPQLDIAPGNYSFTFKGDKTTNQETYTVEIREYILSVTGASSQKSGVPALVTVRGAPEEIITVFRGGAQSLSFSLDTSGNVIGDITNGETLTPGNYEWRLYGNKTSNQPTFSLVVTPSYTITVNGPNSAEENTPINVTINGAPFEQINFNGNTSGVLILNGIGTNTFDITQSSTLAKTRHFWDITGNISINKVTFDALVTPAYTLAVTGPSSITTGMYANVDISGAPLEAINVTRAGVPPLNFYLNSAGFASGDISNNRTLLPGSYAFIFDGNKTPSSVTYNLIVTAAYTLSVIGPSTVYSSQPITLTISGAPNDIITYAGPTSGTYTLNSSGGLIVDLTNGGTIPAGNYTWAFSGQQTTNTVTLNIVVLPAFQLTVAGPSTSLSGAAIPVWIYGAPDEIVTWVGATSGGALTAPFGDPNVGNVFITDLTSGTALTGGTQTWIFSGNKTPNSYTLNIVIYAAPPTITLFNIGAYDQGYWETAGNVSSHKVEFTVGSSFFSANNTLDYQVVTQTSNIGPILLGGSLSFGTVATFRLTTTGPGGTAFQDLTHTIARNTPPVEPTFGNGNFEDTTASLVGSVVTLNGWKIYLDPVKLNGVGSILSNPTPTDFTTPSGSPGDTPTSSADYSYQFVNDAPAGVGSKALRLISTNASTSIPRGIVRGPYLVSENSINPQAGDKVEFWWKAADGGDNFDVFAYLLDTITGNTVVLLDNSGTITSWAKASRTILASEAGVYRFVFIAGSYDASGGTALGASLYLDEIKLVKAP